MTKHLVGVELSLDVCQDLVTLDAWESLGSFEDVSVQLQNLAMRSHGVAILYACLYPSLLDGACLLCF